MTCCLAVSLPNISLAAADTRIEIHHDGQVITDDGPKDMLINLSALGRTIVLPFRYRKIRKISAGWVVYAGEFATGSAVLDLLSYNDSILFTQARKAVLGDALLISRIQSATGISVSQLSKTIIIGAPFGTSTSVWTLGVCPDDTRANRAVGNIAVNWPQNVPTDDRHEAEVRLRYVLESSESNLFAYAKAMSDLIATAAKHAVDVGPYVQLGMTLYESDGVLRSHYFEGLSSELAVMDEANFNKLVEVAT